ncbi:MAG: GlsB/YeaQ/YmgE family stress response membrane protein [Bacteroidota bacterium]
MGWITWIVVGLIAGFLAKLIMPGKDPGGLFVTILIGIVGGIIGGYLGSLIGWGGMSGFDLKSIALATGGSLILLFIYRKLK